MSKVNVHNHCTCIEPLVIISCCTGIFIRRFTFAGIDISYAQFFFYESAEKVLSYARLNCAVLITFICHLDRLDIL